MKALVRIVIALAAFGLVALGSLGTALAQTPTPASTEAHVKGTVSAITSNTVIIHPKEGADIVLKVVASTIITKVGMGKATLSDVVVGDRADARYDKTTLEASKLTVSPALNKLHTFQGVVESVSASGLTVTTKKHGDVDLKVNAETKYKVPGVRNATLSSFKVNDRVAILAAESKDGMIVLAILLIPSKPIVAVHVGIVDNYNAGTSITVKGVRGNSTTFTIDAQTKIELRLGATGVATGDRVIVIARRDPSSDQYTARTIMVVGNRGGPKK